VGLPSPPPDAVVFDNDGLLLETESLWTKAEQKLFDARGRTFTLEHKQAMVGVAGPRAELLLAEMLGEPDNGAELLDELNRRVLVEAEGGVEPMPGAVELLDALAESGTPIGLVSNSPLVFVDAVLAASGFHGRFAVRLTPDHGHAHKPDPALYAEACRTLGAAPDRAVGLEDTATGVAAASGAGMGVIGVPSVPGVELHGADLVAPSLAEPAVWRALGLEPRLG
jgi:HAD superfamily hydrolase (TIGR01509 family)